MGLGHPRLLPAEKEAAYKFIEWLVGGPGAKLWALNGGIPSNTAALSDPEVVAAVPQFELLAEAMPYRHITPLLTTSNQIVRRHGGGGGRRGRWCQGPPAGHG